MSSTNDDLFFNDVPLAVSPLNSDLEDGQINDDVDERRIQQRNDRKMKVEARNRQDLDEAKNKQYRRRIAVNPSNGAMIPCQSSIETTSHSSILSTRELSTALDSSKTPQFPRVVNPFGLLAGPRGLFSAPDPRSLLSGSTTFIVDAIECLAFKGYDINAHVAYKEREKPVREVEDLAGCVVQSPCGSPICRQ